MKNLRSFELQPKISHSYKKKKSVYGKPLTIVQGTLIEADENITPVWHRLQARLDRSKPNQSVGIVSVGEKILVLETVLLLMNKLTDISERGDDFKKLFF